jgi:hypothetical protein
MRHGQVTFFQLAWAPRVLVEIPNSDREETTGLNGRTHLAPSTGMLFDFGREQAVTMSMRETLVSLDMIFLNDRKMVVHVIENAAPGARLGAYRTPVVARYVLEVEAGWARRFGVAVGQEALIEVFR